LRFLDTNILVHYVTGDHPEMTEQAIQLLEDVERGDESVVVSSLVVFEAVFVCERSYRLSIETIRKRLEPILLMPEMKLTEKQLFVRAFDLCLSLNIPFGDAFNLAFMEEAGIAEIYSWDRHFDRVEGITRLEPGTSGPDSR
jgi:uncharacterized protein